MSAITPQYKTSKRNFLSKIGMSVVFVWGLMTQSFAAETVQINFRDADIRSVIESVAEITDKSFVLDARVKGKVTIISPGPIDSSLLYQSFLSALQINGYQAVQHVDPFVFIFRKKTSLII